MRKKREKRILFVCSAGGHLAQVLEMEEIFNIYPYLIITENTKGATHLKEKYNIEFIKPTTRKRDLTFWVNLLANSIKAFNILLRFNPQIIITTGSNVAVPFSYVGKLLRMKIVYILTFAKINTRAKSADLIYPIADVFIVQWKSAKKNYPKAKYLGGGLY